MIYVWKYDAKLDVGEAKLGQRWLNLVNNDKSQ